MKTEILKQRFFEGAPRYTYIETLGRGGVGIVFKARDLELEETVAIKVLYPDVERSSEALLARFKREIHLNRKIKHTNVARMYDFGMSGPYPFITMEFVPGRDLWTIIHEERRLAPARAVSLLRQVARGAEAIHQLGIVHRDLKSQNVIVDERGAAVILDFGLARGDLTERFTQDSIILGTPHYMSPEQASGKGVDPRSDVYSIGVIGFEALTGRLPFTGESPIEVAMMQVNDPVPDLLSHFSEVSQALRGVILRCLEKDPGKRYPTAAEMETALAMLDQPISGVAPSLAPDLGALPGNGMAAEARVPEAEPRAAAPAERAAPRLPQVLLVSGEREEMSGWTRRLQDSGCQTFPVGSGPEALEALIRVSIDLVVMEVALPGLDGFDVTRILKAQAPLAGIPVLLTTSRTDRGQMAFAIQSGAVDLLMKPVSDSDLAERVWKVLRLRGFAPAADAGIRVAS